MLATENPIEFEGVFPLPEAQLDRFFLKARLGYPGEEDELAVVLDQQDGHPLERLQPRSTSRELEQLEAALEAVYVDELVRALDDRLVRATRELPECRSAPPSAAASRSSGPPAPGRSSTGGSYTTPEDVEQMFAPVLGHRLVFAPSFIAESRGRSRDEIADRRLPALRSSWRRRPTRRLARYEVDAAELTFPLVPRWRPVGSAFGRLRAARRGSAPSVAGTRPYRPGDDLEPDRLEALGEALLAAGRPTSSSARTSPTRRRGSSSVADRSPSMGALPGRSALAEQAGRARRPSGRLVSTRRRVSWAWPATWTPRHGDRAGSRPRSARVRRGRDAPGRGRVRRGAGASRRRSSTLARSRRSLPAGTFVFVCSDFLAPPPPEVWLRALGSAGTSFR